MKQAQVINLLEDNVIAFDGDSILKDSDQLPLGKAPHSETIVQVDIDFFNLITGAAVATVSNKAMDYQSASDHWTIDVADFSSALLDRQKYVANVSENGAATGMRAFKIEEFTTDNEIIERYPFDVVADGTAASKITWYSDSVGVTAVYFAQVYEGGTGTNYATHPSKITHRGPITVSP